MDVIGNNIANVNTTAYKSQSVTFSALMYQTTSNASGPNATTGTAGINAKQIGLGVSTGAINTAITNAGSAQTTSNPFDIRISGDSFFVVSDGSNNFFTRDGSFYVDANGNLAMTSNGYNVMGWQVDEETGKIKQDTVTALRIMSAENMTYDPEATSNAYISGIVDKNDSNINSSSGKVINLAFYDNLGYSYTAKLSLHATANEGGYYMELDDVLDSNGESISKAYGTDVSNIVKLGAATSVNVDEAYNVLTSSFKYTDASNVTDTYTRATTYDEGTQTYTFCFKDSNGTIVTDTTLIDDLVADQKMDISNMTAVGDGTYTISLADVKNMVNDGTNGVVAANYQSLQTLFGDSIVSSMTDGTVDEKTGTLTITNKNIQGGLITYNTDTGAFISANGDAIGLKLDFEDYINNADGSTTSLGNFSDITIDMTTSKNSNNGGSATLSATSGDLQGIGTGRKLGNMSGITISNNGEIYASYDNGMSRLLGQIAVAEFANASGLEKMAENLYAATLNSGEFDGIGVDCTVSGGSLNTGQLEMSNVDLATEFTDLITTQRGYQANSRIITTSDSLLEELVNLKR